MPVGKFMHDDFYSYNIQPRNSDYENAQNIGSFDVPAGLILSLFQQDNFTNPASVQALNVIGPAKNSFDNWETNWYTTIASLIITTTEITRI